MCKIDGCETTKLMGRGLCAKHYMREYRHGDPEACDDLKGVRFVEAHLHDDVEGPCVLFPFGRDTSGYGMVTYQGKRVRAHRLLLILRDGQPPTPKHHALHLRGHTAVSGLRHCIVHVRWGTNAENIRDRYAER